ncbi:MAG TPA: pyridoxal-dependent decarboxylase [Saprospiraceae bacterium]|nr:pyridoxal-dependent decarboxylase [Saprospiraceae bacterium]HNT21241.1 pyridoxal-dependent decarboxylase [Saprospiraceae bacterium]
MKQLSWFLGPKGENEEIFTNTILTIIRDYIHWRRNYFPADPILITRRIQRQHEEEFDKLMQGVAEMTSQLRRNFPFYSPRYIGHMLSDINMPSVFGYFAAMLYNANNVTPEGAPVTVEWEIEASNQVLKMLGFNTPPVPPGKEAGIKEWQAYEEKLKTEFGWAHITSGGTLANVEALWVARIIKYFPLTVHDIAREKGLDIAVNLPNGKRADLKALSPREAIGLSPETSIGLFACLIEAISKSEKINIAEAVKKSDLYLRESPYSLTNHLGRIFSEFPPVIFASGAAHYSIKKAADVLGIGRNNVVLVKTDSRFRLDVKDLELKIMTALEEGKIPIAVIAIAGNTEEGAVDPVHEIAALREQIEARMNTSFWLHIDGAWGGYIRSLFKLSQEEKLEILVKKLNRLLDPEAGPDTDNGLVSEIYQLLETTRSMIQATPDDEAEPLLISVEQRILRLKEKAGRNEFNGFRKKYLALIDEFGTILRSPYGQPLSEIIGPEDFKIRAEDRARDVASHVSDTIDFSLKAQTKPIRISWGGDLQVVKAFLSFKKADSITVDPHKLGYIQYPCGLVAFKNDRIRHFIMQRAPYITSTEHDILVHHPPRHVKDVDYSKLNSNNIPYENYHIGIDAFAPFILEGSKPGAAAAALWFSSRMIPLNRSGHGRLIKSSLLATRELYEWLRHWEEIYQTARFPEPLTYTILTFPEPPDTNVLVFAVKNKTDQSLREMNALTGAVYGHFSIQVEQGDKEHSYAQSFFVSHTRMDEQYYPFDSLADFFTNAGISRAREDYNAEGLLVIRCTPMNPYTTAIRQSTSQNLIQEFVWQLHKVVSRLKV